jgi:methylated-DNA-[protein]-cysteine S-methyltransferase
LVEDLAMSEMYCDYYESPIGLIEVAGTSTALVSLCFVETRRTQFEAHPNIGKAVKQLAEYFAGTRREFEVDITFAGTDFQNLVWRQLLKTPYGHMVSYQDIAHAIGRPKAARAVGGATGQNPVTIIVPCHRIIGSNGTLTGYGGGLWRKEWLLKHEGCELHKR